MGRWRGPRQALLCLMAGLGAGMVLCRALGYGDRYLWAMTGLGALCGVLGQVVTGRRLSWAVAGLLGTAALSAGLGYWAGDGLWGGVYALAVTAALFLAACAGDFCAPLSAGAMAALSLAALLEDGTLGTVAGLGLLLAGLLTMDGLRARSLDRGWLSGGVRSPGATGHSLLLTAIFLGLAMAGASAALLLLWGLGLGLSALGRALSGDAAALYDRAGAWLDRLRYEFMSHFHDHGPEPGTRVSGGGTATPLPGAAVVLAALGILALLSFLAVAALGLAAVWHLRRRPRERRRAPVELDYVEEVEALERPRPGTLLRRWRRARPGDYQGAMKIRFAFQTLLRRRLRTDGTARSRTPNELREPGNADQNTLIDAYNRVRYGDGSCTEAELRAAERVLKTRR